MDKRVILLVALSLFVAIGASVDAQLISADGKSSDQSGLDICVTPSGALFVRKHCKRNEKDLDPAAFGIEPEIIFRDVEHRDMVDPGEELIAAALCERDEVVVAGGYITEPELPVRVTLDGAFFDGQRSGWRVDLLNVGDSPETLSVRVNVSCIEGRGVPGDPVPDQPMN